jgi:hypothetical protein
MKPAHLLPPKAAYRGDAPSQAKLLARHEAIQTHHDEALSQVRSFTNTHKKLGENIKSDLAGLKKHNQVLNAMQRAEEEDTGVLLSLVKRFTRRRTLLNRRSETHALLARHESVSVQLRRASAFTDILRLQSLQLHEEVQSLHSEIGDAKHNSRLAAERMLKIEEQLQKLDDNAEASDHTRLQSTDSLQYELRQESHTLELYQATAKMAQQHLEPAQKLRDMVTRLQEEMSDFVVHATGTIDAAGRRIQALGAAADAPMVVTELQESMDDLTDAMKVTEDYVAQTQQLITHVLPDLSAKVKAEAETQHFLLQKQLEEIDRQRARQLAESALKAEAALEVEQLLGKE